MLSHIIAYLVMIIIIFALYIVTGEVFVLGLVVLLLAFFALQAILNIILVRSLEIDVTMKNSLASKRCVELIINVTNGSKLPAMKGVAKMKVINRGFELTESLTGKFTVRPGQSKVVYELSSDYCGRFDIKIDHIRIYDMMGVTFKTKIKKMNKTVYLYPEMSRVRSVTEVRRVNYEKERYFSHQKNTNLSEILQYRSYQPGDNLRHINWKLSDRYDDLLVREFDTPTDNQVLVTFDTDSTDKTAKSMVYSALMSISSAYTMNGIFHQVGWYNEIKRSTAFLNIFNTDDLYASMRMIFDNDVNSDVYGIKYLLRSGALAKYAKVVYVTSHLDSKLMKRLNLYENVQVVLISDELISKNKGSVKEVVRQIAV